jgi:N-acetylglucosamine kinase-like BadF-type ATPase
MQQVRVADFDGVVRWSVGAGSAEVAALTHSLLAAADTGDEVAQTILENGAIDLASHVTAMARDWAADARPAPVALGGGLLQIASYRALVTKRLSDNAGVDLHPETVDPVAGALALGRRG